MQNWIKSLHVIKIHVWEGKAACCIHSWLVWVELNCAQMADAKAKQVLLQKVLILSAAALCATVTRVRGSLSVDKSSPFSFPPLHCRQTEPKFVLGPSQSAWSHGLIAWSPRSLLADLKSSQFIFFKYFFLEWGRFLIQVSHLKVSVRSDELELHPSNAENRQCPPAPTLYYLSFPHLVLDTWLSGNKE